MVKIAYANGYQAAFEKLALDVIDGPTGKRKSISPSKEKYMRMEAKNKLEQRARQRLMDRQSKMKTIPKTMNPRLSVPLMMGLGGFLGYQAEDQNKLLNTLLGAGAAGITTSALNDALKKMKHFPR